MVQIREPWIICDIDGTISRVDHRLHFLRGDRLQEMHHRQDPDWDSFNRACEQDEVKRNITDILGLARQGQWKIAMMTGRSDRYKRQTLSWLCRHGIPYDKLFMRREGDFRSDVDVKEEIYRQHLESCNVRFVLEDRDKVVEMWRRIGLTCLQVCKGEY